jgi:hypothetical protein
VSEEPQYDSSDEQHVKGRKTKAKIRREDQLSCLRDILETEGGQEFFWRLLSRCRLYETSFTGNSQTFFNEGKREVGLWILSEIVAADPAAYSKMMTKNTEEFLKNG